MKSILTKLTMFAAAMLLFSGSAHAMDSMVKATVPFPFVVNGRSLPAGKYLISRDISSPSILLIRSTSNPHASVLVSTNRDGGKDPLGSKAALTFKKVENEYQLTNVWDSQDEGFDVLGR
jgi:hypothetical protein